LDSWKEIAAYLGRTERTVRRWEEREGLPVHRLVHEKRGTVYAFRGELDLWQQSRRDVVAEPPPVSAIVTPPRRRRWWWMAGIALVLILCAAAAYWRAQRRTISSIAVLPFQNLSGSSADEWFSDGMTEVLITELTRLRSLRVIAPASVLSYKKTGKSTKQIQTELGADAVIEGSALRVNDQVRITARLIDPSPGPPLWGSDFRRPVEDALSVQKEVAASISRGIGFALTDADRNRLAGSHSIAPAAMEAYLKGLYVANRRDLRQAVELARETVR